MPVDCLMDYIEVYPEGWPGPVLQKNYVLGIVLDPAVETAELGVGEWIQTEDAASFETAMTVSIPREDWQKGPYYDWFSACLTPWMVCISWSCGLRSKWGSYHLDGFRG